MIQRTDDPARHLREVWLGPNGAWRWPFDATYAEWGVGVLITAVSIVVLWLVAPLGVLLLGVSWVAAKATGRYVKFSLGERLGGSHRWYLALLLLFWLLLFPSPASWLTPMSFWLAIPAAIGVGLWSVRRIRPYIDTNRPVRYWTRVIRRVAAGPRPQRKQAIVNWNGVWVDEIREWTTDDLAKAKFLLDVAAVKEEEIFVNTYVRNDTYEAMVWNPTTGRAETSTSVVAWLNAHGVEYEVVNIRYKDRGDVQILKSADLKIRTGPNDMFTVGTDNVIVIDAKNQIPQNRVTQWTRRNFAETFSAAERVDA